MAPRRKTHYQILGVSPTVSREEIKRAYRELVKTQHPDTQHNGNGNGTHEEATEEMMRINDAYATLMDKTKRAEYDVRIGLAVSHPKGKITPTFTSVDEDQQREKFLRTVFHPARTAITKILGMYKKQIRELSADPFDDVLLGDFQEYLDKVEAALRKGSDSLTRSEVPRTLEAAVHMMRNSIAQAADALEEMRHFCNNYDYNHLTMAENLFRISTDLSKQALALTKG
jgi:molecular chaperone DnaJ